MVILQTENNQIPKKAFLGDRRLTEVMLPYGTKEIGDWAFAGCKNLELVLLPDTMQAIGKDVFLNCTRLKRLLVYDKNQEMVLQEGTNPLWNSRKSIEGELLMYAVCWLGMPEMIVLFSEDRGRFLKEIRVQTASYLARPDDEGFDPFLAGGEEDYDDRESDPAYYCRRERLKKVVLLGRYLLLAEMCPQEYSIEEKDREQWLTYMRKQKEAYQLFYEEQHLVKEMFVLYEKMNLFDKDIVSEMLEQVTGQQVELRALLLRKQEEYLQIESEWDRFEL